MAYDWQSRQVAQPLLGPDVFDQTPAATVNNPWIPQDYLSTYLAQNSAFALPPSTYQQWYLDEEDPDPYGTGLLGVEGGYKGNEDVYGDRGDAGGGGNSVGAGPGETGDPFGQTIGQMAKDFAVNNLGSIAGTLAGVVAGVPFGAGLLGSNFNPAPRNYGNVDDNMPSTVSGMLGAMGVAGDRRGADRSMGGFGTSGGGATGIGPGRSGPGRGAGAGGHGTGGPGKGGGKGGTSGGGKGGIGGDRA